MPKIASSKASKKIYSLGDLEKMSRAQIQTTAKAWNVKANLKTTEIIKRVLLQMGTPQDATGDEVQETSQVGGSVSGTSQSATRRENLAVKVEDNSPRTPPRGYHAVATRVGDNNATREWQRQLLRWNQPPPDGAPEPRTPPPPASRIQARSGHIVSPHPNHVSFAPGNVRRMSGPVPWPRESPPPSNSAPQPVATPSTPDDAPPLPDAQQTPNATIARHPAGYEVRRVLRHMQRLVNQQTAERAEATSIISFRRFLRSESDKITQKVDELAWGYAAIARAVVDVMKDDPTLVDGTELMVGAKRKAEWLKYMKENYVSIDRRVNERQAMIDGEAEEEQYDKENQGDPASSGSAFRCEPQAFGSPSRSLPIVSASYRSQAQGFVYDEDDDMSSD